MPTYTVQCGYAATYATTVVVTAKTLEDALEAAIAEASAQSRWRAIDVPGPTFVDAVAEAADADPWAGLRSAIPVPERFTEQGEPPTVTVIVRGGCVEDVAVTGGRVDVRVRDYDTDMTEPERLEIDRKAKQHFQFFEFFA